MMLSCSQLDEITLMLTTHLNIAPTHTSLITGFVAEEAAEQQAAGVVQLPIPPLSSDLEAAAASLVEAAAAASAAGINSSSSLEAAAAAPPAATMAAAAPAPAAGAPAAARPAAPVHKSTAIIPGWSRPLSSQALTIECQKITQPSRSAAAKECYGVMELEVMKFVAYCGGLTIKLRIDDLQHGPVDRWVQWRCGVWNGPACMR